MAGDPGHRLSGPVDVLDGVVEVEAEAATRRRVEPEFAVGQRGAVTARAGLDADAVEAPAT